MATRYWVGGDGNWSDARNHWATSSGGSPSASNLPTSADDVVFDVNSNSGTSAFTVYVDGDSTTPSLCQAFSTSSLDGAMTLQMGTTSQLNCYGSLTLPAANFVVSSVAGAKIKFAATTTGKTIISNGVSFGSMLTDFDGVGGGWTLGDAFTTTNNLTFLNGSFDTNNYAFTANSIGISASTTKSIALGSSAVTLSGTVPINITSTSNLTWNAGTSTITCSNASPTFTGAGLTYYNVSFTGNAGTKTINGANTFSGAFTVTSAANTVVTFGAAQAFTGGATFSGTSQTINGGGFSHTGTITLDSTSAGTHTINGANTWVDLTINAPTAAGTRIVAFGANQTVTGTLTTNGTRGDYRTNLTSTVSGTQRTLTVQTKSFAYTGFQDIVAAGASSPWTLALGHWNLGGNSSITFDNTPLYWVGSTGNWYDGTKWSTSSGGGGGAASDIPGPTNNVIFDAASNTGTGAFTVTVTNNACADFSTGGAGGALDGAMTLAFGSAGLLGLYGSLTLPATNLSVTGSGTSELDFLATTTGKTITTNGVSIAGVPTLRFLGVGGEWTLGSALTATTFQIQAGTFNTANYACTINSIQRTANTGTTTITLGSSALACAGTTPINFTNTTGLTFNANTSTITGSNASPTFTGGGLTFYNVTFSSASDGTATIAGANTFNNLTFTSRNATGRRIVAVLANQTVSGTLTFGTGNTAIRRMRVVTDNSGVQRTITLNGTLATLADVEFADIVAAGTAGTWTGTRIGDGGNNSGITFDAPKTVYWNLAGTQNWSATGWAATNNGVPDVNNFPLAQDTATFTEAGAAGTVTIDVAWWIGSIQMADGVSNRTTAFTLATSTQTPAILGNVTFFSSLTLTGTGAITFRGQSVTQTITSAGVSWTQPITVNAPLSTFKLADNLTNTGTTFTLTAGALDLNNKTLTCVIFSSSNSNTRSIAFGTSSITVTGNAAAVWNVATATNFTYTGTPNVISNYSGSTGTRTISHGNTAGGAESNAISISITAGSDIASLATHFKNVSFSSFTGTLTNNGRTIYGNLTIPSGMTLSGTATATTFAATSGTQEITTNGVLIDFSITVNAPGATIKLIDNLTIGSTRTFTLTAGTLDLNTNKTLSTGVFVGTGSTTRVIAFGTNGQITVTGNNNSVWAFSTATNFTYTGTSNVVFNYSGAVGTRTLGQGTTAGGTEANSVNMYITGGTDNLSLGGSGVFKTLDLTGFSGVLLNGTRFVYGNLLLTSGMLLNAGSSTTTFAATSGTQNITSAGQTMGFPVTINAPGATVSLVDDLAIASNRTLTLTAGTFTANNKNCTTGTFNSSNTNTRTLTMGSGTWTISGPTWNTDTSTNLTLNANTSTLAFTSAVNAVNFFPGGLTYYDVIAPDGSLLFAVVNFGFTANNFTVANTVTAGEKLCRLPPAQTITINGTFTLSGSSGNKRVFIYTTLSAIFTPVTISAAAISLTDAGFKDITAAGAAISWTGTRLGDGGGNTNITFAAPKTVYWNKVAGGNWSDDAWALTSGGATATTNMPLPQDTMIFDDTGLNAGSTITATTQIQLGAWDCSALTNAASFTFSESPTIYGDVTLSSAVTVAGSSLYSLFFSKSGTQLITSAGVTWQINMYAASTVFELVDPLTCSATFVLRFKNLDLNGNKLTCHTFSSSYDLVRSISFNGGYIDVTGNNATVWSCADLTNFSYTGTPTVNFTYAGSSGTRTVTNGVTGGTEANAVDFNITAGSDFWQSPVSADIVKNLNFTGFSGSSTLFGGGYIYGNLILSPTQTVVSSSNTTVFSATSGTKTITTNGVTLNRPIRFEGVGGTWSLQDALNTGSSNIISVYAGTFTTNGYAVTTGKFGNSGVSVVGDRTFNFGASTITCFGTDTTGSSVQIEPSAYSTTVNAGTSTFVLSETYTGSSLQAFRGGGYTYYNVTITTRQTSGFYGSNTFNKILVTANPMTLEFEAGTTQTVNEFDVSGTSGNLIALVSSAPGSQWYIVKNSGTNVLVSYCSITDSVAAPAGYWFAPTSQGNVDGGNNLGWNFSSTGIGSGNFMLFFN